MTRIWLTLLATMHGGVAMAADGMVEIRRGADGILFGSCVPSLLLDNKTDRSLDYVQVDIEFVLRDGRRATLEFKSRYRHGVERPIAAGASATLVVHADESLPLRAACDAIVSTRVASVACEIADRSCSQTVSVKP